MTFYTFTSRRAAEIIGRTADDWGFRPFWPAGYFQWTIGWHA